MLALWVCNVKVPLQQMGPTLKALMVQVQQDPELPVHSLAGHRTSFNPTLSYGLRMFKLLLQLLSLQVVEPIKHLLMSSIVRPMQRI